MRFGQNSACRLSPSAFQLLVATIGSRNLAPAGRPGRCSSDAASASPGLPSSTSPACRARPGCGGWSTSGSSPAANSPVLAKASDLARFPRVLNDCDYVHEPRLAPTADILADYRKDHRWDRYVVRFDALMDERGIASILDRAELATTPSCLLCSEHLPTRCHRRLVAERVGAEWQEFEVRHLT